MRVLIVCMHKWVYCFAHLCLRAHYFPPFHKHAHTTDWQSSQHYVNMNEHLTYVYMTTRLRRSALLKMFASFTPANYKNTNSATDFNFTLWCTFCILSQDSNTPPFLDYSKLFCILHRLFPNYQGWSWKRNNLFD